MVSTQKSVAQPQRISRFDRLLGQQEGELGVEKAVTGRFAYPALSLGRLQCTVQLPTRGTRFQFGTGGRVMLDIDDPSLLLPDMGCRPIDIGQHLLLAVTGLVEQALLHIDDQ